MHVRSNQQRSGAVTVEFAVTAGIAFFLVLAMIIGGAGVFRYQEVAHLAREGARYASTHGGQYTLDGMPGTTGVPAVSSNSDMQTYLLARATLLETNRFQATVSYSAPATMTPRNIPIYTDTNPSLVPPAQKTIRNYVTVTVTYQWMPELFLTGPITLTSSSTMAITY